MSAFLLGLGLGFAVAAQLGPMSLLLIRSTVRHGVSTGLAIGAGIATVDLLYAALGVAGAAPVLSIDALRVALGLLGAAVLLALGARTLWTAFRVRAGGESDEEVAAPRRAFLTGLAGTASNPLTIGSWAAVFAAASTAGAAHSPATTLALVAGVGLGSLAWVSILAVGVGLARRRVTPRVERGVDLAAGSAIAGFGGLLGVRTLHDG
jgi:putative LysE/RhtB family amino acid efflux pump